MVAEEGRAGIAAATKQSPALVQLPYKEATDMGDLPQDNPVRNSALEPLAYEMRPDDDGRVRVSIAISLKRLADAMERQVISGDLLFDEIPF